MTSDARIATAKEFFEKSFRGEVPMELLEEDVIYDVAGVHQLMGHFEGREAVAQHMSKLRQLTHETVNVLQWEDWLVGVNHVCGFARMGFHLDAVDETLSVIFLITMSEDDKIRQIEVFFSNLAAAEHFFW
jgi:ketosteroid isomerase-like protein